MCCRNTLSLTNEHIFTLVHFCMYISNVPLFHVIVSTRSRIIHHPGPTAAVVLCSFWGLIKAKSIHRIGWRTFQMKVAAQPTKRWWTQNCITLARWSYFYWLIIVQHAWETHGWVQATQKSSPLVLHNTQLCMEAGRGRCDWSSQCLQVILFIIQMKTLFHYPWGSRSNALMSPTVHVLAWYDSTTAVHVTDDERQKTGRGRQNR